MISIYFQSGVITYTVKKINEDPTFVGRVTLSDEAIVSGKIVIKEEIVESLRKIFKIIGNHNDTITVVLPAISCNIKTLDLPEGLDSNEAKVYANSHAFDLISGDYEYDHFISKNKITYLYYSREQLELIQDIFKEVGHRVDYFDIPNIGAVREQYYITPDKERFEVTPACYVFVTEQLVLLQINEGLFPLATYLANMSSYNSMNDLINDEAYRLCNFYRWNLSKGKKQVENLYIYNLNTSHDVTGVTKELTGAKNVIICDGENNAYKTDSDINICLSKALFDPLLAHKIFDLRFRHPFKDTKHYFTVVLAIVMSTLIISSAFFLTTIYINGKHQIATVEQNLNMVQEKYNLAIETSRMDDLNKKQYYESYFNSFDIVKNYNQNLKSYVERVLKVIPKNVIVNDISLNKNEINIKFTCPTRREYILFRDRLFEEFSPIDIAPKNEFVSGEQNFKIILGVVSNEESKS